MPEPALSQFSLATLERDLPALAASLGPDPLVIDASTWRSVDICALSLLLAAFRSAEAKGASLQVNLGPDPADLPASSPAKPAPEGSLREVLALCGLLPSLLIDQTGLWTGLSRSPA